MPSEDEVFPFQPLASKQWKSHPPTSSQAPVTIAALNLTGGHTHIYALFTGINTPVLPYSLLHFHYITSQLFSEAPSCVQQKLALY